MNRFYLLISPQLSFVRSPSASPWAQASPVTARLLPSVPSPLESSPHPFQGFLEQSLLSQVSSTPPPKGYSASPLPVLAARELYATSLAAASAVISRSNVDGTVRRRLQVGSELSTWLASLPHSVGFASSLLTARPEDLLVFMQSHYSLQHVGSQVPGLPHKVASPQGVSSAFSHLSTLFESLGRRGPYQAGDNSGNPCDCHVIKRYKQGYSRDMVEAGYQEKSAVPLTPALVLDLMAHFDQEMIRLTNPFEQLLNQRDRLLILYNWHSSMRGKEGGQLCLPDLHTSGRKQLFPEAYQTGVPVPDELWVYPTHGTKTNKRSRAHQDPAVIKKEVDPRMCFPTQLWAFMEMCSTSGHPLSHFLFRPQTAIRGQLKEAPFSTSSFIQMLQKHLTKIGKLSGETSHSCRRGALQDTASREGPLAAALQGRIKTPAVLARYLNPFRHMDRLVVPTGLPPPESSSPP